MPRIVEIIGPSGSGKSTIYNLLNTRWKSEYNWVTYDQLQASHVSIFDRISRKFSKAIKKLSPFSNPKPRKTQINPEWKVIKNHNDTFLGDDYSDFKMVLMDLVEEHCKSGFTGVDKRFITVYMVMWSIAYIETIKSYKNDDRLCILNQGEGLISRIMHLNSPTFDEKALKSYLYSAPHPDVLILLNVDADEILNRVKERDRLSSLHARMDEQKILEYTKKTNEMLLNASNILEKSGVDVYRIDASAGADEVADAIIHALSSKN